ncbi:hypothetical protein LSCM1_07290 [Leishmania martiniquensis]|uniref:Nudix hydrolase domain-containing protein n=1 Tax=Leishmania martiniquensis TaxID=1580590 RepID=A0A836KUI1_9TRYP|nr:hypothetical protein LSCM1_07290 [Leishmania martiniquensis]
MSPGVPGVDLALLMRITRRLAERRLHAYRPSSRRCATAVIFRFDDDTQRTLATALSTFRATTARRVRADTAVEEETTTGAASFPGDSSWMLSHLSSAARFPSSSVSWGSSAHRRTDPLELFEYMAHHSRHHQRAGFVDVSAPSSLQMLFLKRANVEAGRWCGRVVLPGGFRSLEDHDDFDTVCRGAYEGIGFPLRHLREFLCLGRLPDYRLHSRVIGDRDLVQARFLFLHVGAAAPTVQLAAHEVESSRWVPLRTLMAARVERRQVAYPLQSFVNPRNADARLILREALGDNICLYFPSLLLPSISVPPSTSATAGGAEADGRGRRGDGEASATRDEASKSSPASSAWRVWGVTLRTVSEVLALGSHQTHDWPLVESDSCLLQYGVLLPAHGYGELLYQLYWWRAWMCAKLRLHPRRGCASGQGTASTGDGQRDSSTLDSSQSELPSSATPLTLTKEQQRWRRVLYGSWTERRYAVLPASADALLFAVPETPIAEHVVSFALVVSCTVFVLYSLAALSSSACAAVGSALGPGVGLQREAWKRTSHGANTPNSVARHRSSAAGDEELRSPENVAAGCYTVTSAANPVELRSEPVSCLCSPRQMREGSAPHRIPIADEAALSAELRRLTEAPHGELLLDSDSAEAHEMVRQTQAATHMLALQPPSPAPTWAGARPPPSGIHAGSENGTRSPSQLMTTTGDFTLSSAASSASLDTVTDFGSGGDCSTAVMCAKGAAGKVRAEVGSTVTGLSLPAERPGAAAMPAAMTELSHEEKLEVIMRRYRAQATASE